MLAYYRMFLVVFIIFSISLFVLSLINIIRGKTTHDARGIGFLVGGFFWLDIFMFSLLWITLTIILFFLQKPILFPIAYLSFWIIRSFGETIYWFNQQFHPDTVPWPEWFSKILFLQSLTQKQWW